MTASSQRPSRSIFFELYAVTQAVRELLRSTMADGPLTPEEYAVYSAVFEAESLTPTVMARALSMPLTTVMERVRLLEGRGHARRVAHPADRRSYRLVLTAAGLAAHRQASQQFEIAYRAFLDAHTADERRTQQRLAQLRSAAERATERARRRTGRAVTAC
ncbi:MAG: hypothetical protein M3P38_04175 [Chloroflexota bacterium]|nr:hypothetical protein [Chloroflexota bacterium]